MAKRSSFHGSDLARAFQQSKEKPEKQRKAREPKFTQPELLCGIQFFAANKEQLLSQLGDQSTGSKRIKLWKDVSAEMSSISGHTRHHAQVKQKIMALRSKFKGLECERLKRLALTGGGSPVASELSVCEGGSESEEGADASIREEIKRIAISTLTEVQLVGFKGVDLMMRRVQKRKSLQLMITKDEEIVSNIRPYFMKLAMEINKLPAC